MRRRVLSFLVLPLLLAAACDTVPTAPAPSSAGAGLEAEPASAATAALAAAPGAAVAMASATTGGASVTLTGVSGAVVDAAAAYPAYHLRYTGDPAPAGYSHDYQWADPSVVTVSPEVAPVTLTGTVDVGAQAVGQVALLGLLDRDGLAAGGHGWLTGAYIYVYRSSTRWKIGVSDGSAAGEIVQEFRWVQPSELPADGVLNVELTVDGTADGLACAGGPATAPAGCLTLRVSGGAVDFTVTDSYGDVGMTAGTEFAGGAVPGWDDLVGSNVGYVLAVQPVAVESTGGSVTGGGWVAGPGGRATFALQAMPDAGGGGVRGSVRFADRGADVRFQGDTIDGLFTTADAATIEGSGRLNGQGGYRFRANALDREPDAFGLRIWLETGGVEVVIYDTNGALPLGGGNVRVGPGR